MPSTLDLETTDARQILLWRICEAEFVARDWVMHVASQEWQKPVCWTSRRSYNSISLYVPVMGSAGGNAGIYNYLGGRGRIRFPQFEPSRSRPVSRALFLPNGIEIEADGPGGRTRTVHLNFHDDCIKRIVGEELDLGTRNLEAGLHLDGTPIVDLLQRMMAEALNPGFASGALLEAIGVETIIQLARHMRDDGALASLGSTLAHAQLSIIRDRVNATGEPVPTVAEIAQLCGMSDRNLLRQFKQTTGETVSAFIHRVWLDRTRELLNDGQVPLKEIAYRAGFAGHSAFSAAFRRATGETPSQYRRRIHRRAVSYTLGSCRAL